MTSKYTSSDVTSSTSIHDQHADDTEVLRALGYSSDFKRSMSLWENFALGFTYLSPVVGIYTVFQFALSDGGPPVFWTYLIVGLGQLMVALVFGEVVSQFPISGGLYPWARRLVGKRWAWMAGWVYLWALCSTIAAVAVGGAPFMSQLFGVAPSHGVEIGIAIAMIVGATLLNLVGTRLLARIAMIGFICELIGAVVVGGYLLLFARVLPFSAVFDTYGVNLDGNYLPAFISSSVAAMFCYYGFEACGDVAEETPNPSKMIPKAMRLTIYVGGGAAMFILLALILAVPNMADVLSGKDMDPVATILRGALGEVGFRAVLAIVMISFVSCVLSLQAAASRLLFSYARDEMIFGSASLSKLSSRSHVPAAALITVALFTSGVAVLGFFMENAVKTIVIFGAVGIYIGFQMIVLAALIARARGWVPTGKFRLGIWAWPVNLIALSYGLAAITNMMWPRAPDDAWYVNYGMMFSSAIVIGTGLVYMIFARPHGRSGAPSGDAHLLHLTPAQRSERIAAQSSKLGSSRSA